MVSDDDVARVVAGAGAEMDPLLREMTDHGHERGFPIVGPAAGRFLRVLARTVDAERVFEFGSGFGYSAAWFAGALPADGEVVLTDYDGDNLDEAREFLARGGHDDVARYVVGDARETYAAASGPFDVVLIDAEKTRYVETFEVAREKLADGGLVVADNMLDGPLTPAEVADALEGESVENEHAAGIADYLAHVRDDPDFDTSVVPLGSGLAVSARV